MTEDQLRSALRELNAERDLTVVFADVHAPASTGANALTVKRAMLIPDEEDHLVKVTDGNSIFVIEARHVAWMKIG
jgi:hypothetical protein